MLVFSGHQGAVVAAASEHDANGGALLEAISSAVTIVRPGRRFGAL